MRAVASPDRAVCGDKGHKKLKASISAQLLSK